MRRARICRAVLSRPSESRQHLGTARLFIDRAQLCRHAVSASARVPRLIGHHDDTVWKTECNKYDSPSASLPFGGSREQAKELVTTRKTNDEAIKSRHSTASSIDRLPLVFSQTSGTSSQSTVGYPSSKGQHGRRSGPNSQLKSHRPRRDQSVSAIIRTFAKSNHIHPGGGSPEAWRRECLRQSLYQQWGYIRHQYPPSEVLPARRAFKSWKIKLSHVLDPVNPYSWQWHEQGRWLFELDTVAAMHKAWKSKDRETGLQEWPQVMLSTMHLCPDKAGMVLDATLDPKLPGYAIHDVLRFVVQRFHLEDSLATRERTIKADEMLDLASRTVEDMPVHHVRFGQGTFGILARKLPSEQADELYTILLGNGCKLHANTLLQFASKFAGDRTRKASAFDILKTLADAGMDLNDARPASVITTLLHCKTPQDGDEHQVRSFSPTEALQALIEKGFSPNVINATAFLDSLCQRAEVEEAIRLALLFAECGTQLDTRTWVTVFRGAKNSLNVSNVVKALDVAKAANAPYVDVLNNLLHTIYCFAEAESRERHLAPPWVLPLFTPMLRIYAKKFDLEPLQWWLPDVLSTALAQDPAAPDAHGQTWSFSQSVVPVVDGFFSIGGPSRLQPSMTTIAIMLRSYVRSLRDPHDLMSFYGFFKSRLEEDGGRGRLARELIKDQGSLIHDALILAMTEHQLLARQALQVFGDMLKGHLNTDSADGCRALFRNGGEKSTAPAHPSPSVMTFTILLRGLITREEHILAEQVVQFMDELGVKANLVTWNTLIKGHASLQNVKRTVATLQDMEAAGFRSDNLTFNAFAKLRNQNKALKMLQSILDENKQKLMEQEPALADCTEPCA